jgi:TolA-binding protein
MKFKELLKETSDDNGYSEFKKMSAEKRVQADEIDKQINTLEKKIEELKEKKKALYKIKVINS